MHVHVYVLVMSEWNKTKPFNGGEGCYFLRRESQKGEGSFCAPYYKVGCFVQKEINLYRGARLRAPQSNDACQIRQLYLSYYRQILLHLRNKKETIYKICHTYIAINNHTLLNTTALD